MKETLRRLAAWVMSLLMILNGLPVTALAADAVVDTSEGLQVFAWGKPSTSTYKLYYYGLIPGIKLEANLSADKKWFGLGISSISNVGAPSSYGVGNNLDANTVEEAVIGENIQKALYPDLTIDGTTYKHAKTEEQKNQKGYYYLTPIRLRVSDGANAGNNQYNTPTISSEKPTFHYDFTVILNETNYCTINFLVQKPDNNTFEALEKYSARIPTNTEESKITRPSDDDLAEITYKGVTYVFDGWYKDEDCTIKANFDGAITKNTNYYGKYVPKNAKYKVEYYLQDVGADGKRADTYTIQSADTVETSGLIGSTATYDEKLYTNYTFEKAMPSDRTILADGSLVIKVYYKRNIASLTIVKEVEDDTTTERGEFTFTVSYNGNQVDTITLNADNNYTGEVTDLAVGKTFTVTEQANEAVWTTKVGNAAKTSETVTIAAGVNTVTFTNTRTLYGGDGRLTVKKEWKDADGSDLDDAYIPDSVQVQLYRQIAASTAEPVGSPVTLTKTGGWQYTYTNLPATDAAGNSYAYTMQEVGVDANGKLTADNGYRFTVSGANQRCTTADVTITNTLDRVNVAVTKQWVLNGITLTEKPTVTFTLMQGNTDIGTLIPAPDTADVYTLANVPYRTDYTVDESLSGGTVADSTIAASTLFTPQTDVALTGTTELTATVTNTANKYGITISKTATWADGMDVTIPAFTFTVDDQTVTLQPATKGQDVSTQVLVSSNEATVVETPVTGWNADETSITVQAGRNAAFTNTRDTLPADQPLTITKVIDGSKVSAMAKDTFDFTVTAPSDLKTGTQVTYTVAGGTPQTTTVTANHTFVIEGVKDGQTATVTSALPTGTYTVAETANANNAHTYTAQITHTGNAFTATNTPVTNSIAFTKQWEQPNGAQPANTAYDAANASATFGLFDGTTKIAETTSAGGTVTFTNVPTGTGKTYTIRELSLSGADNYTVSSDVLTVTWKDNAFAFDTGKATITNPLKRAENWTLSLTKQVENSPAADAGATFTVRYSYKLPGASTAVTQDVTLSADKKQDVVLNLPVGTKITVEEVLGNAADAWDTYFQAGTTDKVLADSRTYTVSGTGLAVTITNSRTLFGGNGTLTLTKTWVDSNNADKQRPNPQTFANQLTLYSKAGEDGVWNRTGAVAAVNDNYTITYANLPAYDLNGNEMSYAVAEAVTAPYTLTYTKAEAVVTVAEGVQAITSGGFINTLMTDLAITKLWRNSDGKAIPAAQTTQVELLRDDDKLMEVTLAGAEDDASIQTATISVPKYDESGDAYNYTIHEVGEEDGTLTVGENSDITYTVTYNGLTVTNTKAQPDKTAEPAETVDVDDGEGNTIAMVPVGGKITFTIGYENYLPEKATVTVTDTLPVGLQFVANGSTAGYTVDAQTVTWTLTDVPALTSGTITLVAEVTADALTGADPSVSNTASVILGNVTEATATTENTIYNPDWTVTKALLYVNGEAPADSLTVKAGDTLTYAITVTNIGNCNLTGLEVNDTFLVDGETVPLTLTGDQDPASFDLKKSEAITFTATYTVEADDKQLSNTAAVGDESSTVETTVEDNPQWTVVKTIAAVNGEAPADSLTVKAGDTLTYAITVTNTGNCDLTDLTITDTLNVDGVNQSLTVTDAAGNAVTTFDLAKGETVVFTATYTVEADDKQLSNTAAVGDETGKIDTEVEDNPGWTVVKTIAEVNGEEPADSLTVKVGDTLTYAITVTNTGNCDLTGLEVEDTFVVDGETVLLTLSGDRNPANFDLAKGETVVFTATYTVEADDKQLSNTAAVGDETGRIDTDVDDNPQWKLDKALADKEGNPITGTQPVYKPGDTVRYVITAVNTGNVDLTNLTISDLFLVDGVDMTDALITDEDLTESFNLGKGEAKTFHASYVVKATDKVLSNTVTSEGKKEEVITEVEDAPAWTVEKYVLYVNGKEVTAEQTYNVGDKVTYAIVVTNMGNCDVQGLKAEDLLTASVVGTLKLTGTRGENPDGFTLPRYADAQKKPGTVTFLAEYTLRKSDKMVVNLARVGKPDDGKDPETDEVVIAVEDYPDVELIKTVDNKGTGKDGSFRGGDTIRYKVEVRNTGNCLLEDLQVEDVFEVDGLLTELTLTPATGRFDLEAGESKVFYASYVIKDKDTCLVNEATVSNGETEGGDRVVITTEPNPSVTVLKEVTNIGYGLQGAFLPGDEVDYRVTVTNTGNCDLYDLTLTDSLYGDDTRLKITLPEEAASFNLMKGETIVFQYSYRTQEGYSLLVNTAKVLDATSRVKTRIVTDPISPAAMPPAYGYTSNVGDCFD